MKAFKFDIKEREKELSRDIVWHNWKKLDIDCDKGLFDNKKALKRCKGEKEYFFRNVFCQKHCRRKITKLLWKNKSILPKGWFGEDGKSYKTFDCCYCGQKTKYDLAVKLVFSEYDPVEYSCIKCMREEE